jgi:hypothetical protein
LHLGHMIGNSDPEYLCQPISRIVVAANHLNKASKH